MTTLREAIAAIDAIDRPGARRNNDEVIASRRRIAAAAAGAASVSHFEGRDPLRLMVATASGQLFAIALDRAAALQLAAALIQHSSG